MVCNPCFGSIATWLTTLDLVDYCVRENVPFTIFEDWSSILSTVKEIVAGKTNVKDVAAAGCEDFKRGGRGGS